MTSLTTHGITISVRPRFEADRSAPDRFFAFSYFVRIENNSPEAVQLLTRYWRIVHLPGPIQEVEGEGVIGRQPVLEPGQSHEYASWVPLSTELGFMEGHYEMVRRQGGDTFQARIPRFELIPDFKLN